MNQRVNIYGFPHKGLRNALGKLSFNLGKLDVSSEEQIQEIKLLSNEVSELLKLHLHSEEKHVLVPLKEKDPKIADHNHEDHLKMERLEDQMMFSIHQLIDSPDIGIAIKSYQETNLFIREYFRHMDEEENEINEIIWSHFSDAAQRTQVYTAQDYIDILKSLIHDWKIEGMGDLSDVGEKARDYLVTLPDRLQRVTDRMKEPEKEYEFKWIG